MTERVFNFSPGPATLPLPVLQEVQQNLLALPGVGASVLEISHRSKTFEEMIAQAEANIRALLNLPEEYYVLFLQGGASLQFSQVPMSFLRGTGRSADYIVTGSWAKRALAEAQREGSVRIVWDGKADNYSRVPKHGEYEIDPSAAYVHFTSNETIQGIQFPAEPEVGDVPLVCDASSDFLSRPIDVKRYGLIYAGAQKNVGPAGVTIVIIRQDMLEQVPDDLPTMLNYTVHVEHRSLYNTPPVFAVYVVMLVTRWLLENIGGLEQMHAINQQKAQLLYEAIDRSEGFYRGHAQPDSRSLMNATWRLPSEELEVQFVKEAKEAGLHELKGHRSVGGIRASMYNAMPIEGVRTLVEFMEHFRQKHA
jgi:phosphoserine aminotransferase